MPLTFRLLAQPGAERGTVHFQVAIAAPEGNVSPWCAPARLETGDSQGTTLDLGQLCAPTETTWVDQHLLDLGSHAYQAPGPVTARLSWGNEMAQITVDPSSPARPLSPSQARIDLFELQPDAQVPDRVRADLKVSGMGAGQRVRLDAGTGQIRWLSAEASGHQAGSWLLSYVKPSVYSISVDLVDGDGFWLANLAASTVQVSSPEDSAETGLAAPDKDLAQASAAPLVEVPTAKAVNPPWLPFNYVRPRWNGAPTYTQPGGSRVSRRLVPGTYLAIQAETEVGGVLWFRSTYGDWISAAAVDLVQPSQLRGVELERPPDPPGPPDPPPATRRGVVTAQVLNVRAEPGVRPDNPPIDRLSSGAQVDIYEEQSYAGAIWYRIGSGRWVHSGWVQLLDTPPPQPGPEPFARGVVTATALNVRAQPGVRPDNPPIDRLNNGAEVNLYEEQSYAGATWYRIGSDRWVHGDWIRIVEAQAISRSANLIQAVNEPLQLPVGWVVSPSLNVRARPGVSNDNPPIDEVFHNQLLDIQETRTVGGSPWYRIGENRWVYGSWVAVAQAKARPSSIGSSERWVGVDLSRQTAVAYEGDRPVYAAMIASGLPGTPTVQGIFRTWLRLPWRKMSGGSAATGGYYYLEEVTWTCYFYGGYALHTAYWHDAFGRPRSHGCVNMSPYDAWWMFNWSAPGGSNSPRVYVYS